MQMLGVVTRLAWRYLGRNHRRTIIMIGAITVGVWAMIFMTALTRGMVDQVIVDGVAALPGHVQMHDPEYIDDPSVMIVSPLTTPRWRSASTMRASLPGRAAYGCPR